MTSLPALLPHFNEALRTQLFPALASRYPDAAPDPAGLRVLDAFLVKYHAGAQVPRACRARGVRVPCACCACAARVPRACDPCAVHAPHLDLSSA